MFKRCLQRAQESYSLAVVGRGYPHRSQCGANLEQRVYGGDYVTGRPAKGHGAWESLRAATR